MQETSKQFRDIFLKSLTNSNISEKFFQHIKSQSGKEF